jgi:hypothetical protein
MAERPIQVKYDVILDDEREKDMPEYHLWDFVFTVRGDVVLSLYNAPFQTVHHI